MTNVKTFPTPPARTSGINEHGCCDYDAATRTRIMHFHEHEGGEVFLDADPNWEIIPRANGASRLKFEPGGPRLETTSDVGKTPDLFCLPCADAFVDIMQWGTYYMSSPRRSIRSVTRTRTGGSNTSKPGQQPPRASSGKFDRGTLCGRAYSSPARLSLRPHQPSPAVNRPCSNG
jgi:hypothetical protein